MSRPPSSPWRVAALVGAALLFYMVNVVALVDEGPKSMKFAIMGIFSVPGIILLLSGTGTGGHPDQRRNAGIVFLSAAGVTAAVVLNVCYLLAQPEWADRFPPDMKRFFGDFWTAGTLFAAYLALGAGLLYLGCRKQA